MLMNCQEKRYIAGIANWDRSTFSGGLFAGSIVMLFQPVTERTGRCSGWLALLGAISSNIDCGHEDMNHQCDSASITFLATASGMHFLGLKFRILGICIGLIWRI